MSFVVPGAKELEKLERQRDAQLSAKETERQRKAAEREAYRRHLEEVEKQKEKERQDLELKARRRVAEKARSITKADRVLNATFAFGKILSVLAVLIAIVTIVGSLLDFITASPDLRPVDAQPKAPSYTDFESFLAMAKSAAVESDDFRLVSDDSLLPDEMDRLLAELGIPRRELLSELDQIPAEMHPMALAEALQFLQVATTKQLERSESKMAVAWFMNEYLGRIKERNAVVEYNDLQRLQASLRKTRSATVAITALGTLMAFLILPLLIRIEQNTRAIAMSDD